MTKFDVLITEEWVRTIPLNADTAEEAKAWAEKHAGDLAATSSLLYSRTDRTKTEVRECLDTDN